MPISSGSLLRWPSELFRAPCTHSITRISGQFPREVKYSDLMVHHIMDVKIGSKVRRETIVSMSEQHELQSLM